MKINHNISAIIANTQLKRTENRLTKSTERLSTGYKINSAADDPAGLAISKKMREQIRGLERSSQNALDGISVLQTADGTLNEINSITQRIRQLTIQGMNETYTLEDRENIQAEVDSLTEEVDRLVSDTEFNNMTLLDGSLSYRAFTDSPSVKVTGYSKNVVSQEYAFTVDKAASKAVLTDNTAVTLDDPITAAQAGTITINGVKVKIEEGDTADEVFSKIRDTAKLGDVDVFAVTPGATPDNTFTDVTEPSAGYPTVPFANNTTALLFVSEEYGSNAHVSVSADNPQLLTALGLAGLDTDGDNAVRADGVDAQITLDVDSGFTSTATYVADGNKVTITDRGGFSMNVTVAADTLTRMADDATLSDTIGIQATGMGAMELQIGARQNQTLEVMIPSVSVQELGMDNLNMLSAEGLERSLGAVDKALGRLTEVRAIVGAYQNRLESTSTSIEETSFNMEEAFSRVMDTDMAEEMTNYTKENVLAQAGTAMLAQANDRPQQVLQLLS